METEIRKRVFYDDVYIFQLPDLVKQLASQCPFLSHSPIAKKRIVVWQSGFRVSENMCERKSVKRRRIITIGSRFFKECKSKECTQSVWTLTDHKNFIESACLTPTAIVETRYILMEDGVSRLSLGASSERYDRIFLDFEYETSIGGSYQLDDNCLYKHFTGDDIKSIISSFPKLQIEKPIHVSSPPQNILEKWRVEHHKKFQGIYPKVTTLNRQQTCSLFGALKVRELHSHKLENFVFSMKLDGVRGVLHWTLCYGSLWKMNGYFDDMKEYVGGFETKVPIEGREYSFQCERIGSTIHIIDILSIDNIAVKPSIAFYTIFFQQFLHTILSTFETYTLFGLKYTFNFQKYHTFDDFIASPTKYENPVDGIIITEVSKGPETGRWRIKQHDTLELQYTDGQLSDFEGNNYRISSDTRENKLIKGSVYECRAKKFAKLDKLDFKVIRRRRDRYYPNSAVRVRESLENMLIEVECNQVNSLFSIIEQGRVGKEAKKLMFTTSKHEYNGYM
jgi:Late expression factor 4 (LEF-4)